MNEQYTFNRLPQGLHLSPIVFHQALAKVLSTFSKPDCILQYVDDILLLSESEEEHLILLAELFDLLQDAILKLKLIKFSS